MTVGELKKLLEKFEDEQTIMVVYSRIGGGDKILHDIADIAETVSGPKIFID